MLVTSSSDGKFKIWLLVDDTDIYSEYSKTCVKRPLKKKIDKIKVLMTTGSLIKVKVLQNAPFGAFFNTFDLY